MNNQNRRQAIQQILLGSLDDILGRCNETWNLFGYREVFESVFDGFDGIMRDVEWEVGEWFDGDGSFVAWSAKSRAPFARKDR